MARRRTGRSKPEVVDDDEDMMDDDDEFAWQSPKKKKKKKSKSATGRKKRSKKTSGRSSSGRSSGEGKKKSRSATGKRKRASGSAKLAGSSKRSSSSARSSGRRRRSSSGDDDGGTSGRRRGRSGRPPIPRKKQGINPIVLISMFTGTILLCAIIIVAATSKPEKQVDNQPARLESADAVAAEGMAAFRAWNKAKREGNAAAESAKWKESHSKLQKAVDMYNEVLDQYRDKEGYLPPEYEGYEKPLSEISKHLIDLEKSGKVR
jgi:hypothetical protein